MNKLTNLKFLFTAIALLEFFYFLCGMMPPSWVLPVTGWTLTADGQWITKLVGLALGFMAYIAWIYRKDPTLQVARGLAVYQVASATIDWVMWLVMKDQGIFGNELARSTVAAAIISHYVFGILLFVAMGKTRETRQ